MSCWLGAWGLGFNQGYHAPQYLNILGGLRVYSMHCDGSFFDNRILPTLINSWIVMINSFLKPLALPR